MSKFAKLFSIDEKFQVLVTTTCDHEEEEANYLIELRVDRDGAEFKVAIGYELKEDRDKKFQEFEQADALNFFKSIDVMF